MHINKLLIIWWYTTSKKCKMFNILRINTPFHIYYKLFEICHNSNISEKNQNSCSLIFQSTEKIMVIIFCSLLSTIHILSTTCDYCNCNEHTVTTLKLRIISNLWTSLCIIDTCSQCTKVILIFNLKKKSTQYGKLW